MPPLPDTFLGGSAPRLRTFHISGISFPAVLTLLSSAHDLIYVHLRNIPLAGYIPPEKMVASLAALPRLKYLTLGFKSGMPYLNRIRLPPTTRKILLVLSRFTFYGPILYLEDLMAQIDAPQLNYLRIEYMGRYGVADFQIPQLCKFIDRSQKLRFRRAELVLEPSTVILKLSHRGQSSFRLSIQKKAMGQVVSQISAMLSDVDFLFINSDQKGGDDELGDGVRWREIFRPFTALKALSADDKIACHIPFSLNNIAWETATEMLPALELLCLENEPAMFVRKFVATRQSMGRPVTFINKGKEFQERLNMLDVCE
ncbi:hypothetical protein EDB83DRAFT_2519270 [Lactarius deliciosus]|nr:hypothetical protein EDB83DRAFT_2519270 [Lactarius deliciosus]